ncbi:MAG: carbohydrate ABC transporter permease [Oscillospiraceae bacterium]|jgi:raffinose/stachyose/melibiose transport system permease protein|nr:carbohydrate ABC transporter permease [Oscillospiraceae bacterium]
MKEAHSASLPVRIVSHFVLILWSLTIIVSLYWLGINSFKNTDYIRRDSFSLPNQVTKAGENGLGNYELAFKRYTPPGVANDKKVEQGFYKVLAMYGRGLLISGIVVVGVLVLGGFCAYGMARYNFKGKQFYHYFIIASMMFPAFATIVPVFRMFNSANGVIDPFVVFLNQTFGSNLKGLNITTASSPTWVAMTTVILPQLAGNLAFSIVIMTAYIRGIPVELEEAAYMEGCSIPRIFFRIILPIAKPVFATAGIFSFLWSFNDIFTQRFFLLNPKSYTITRMMMDIATQRGVNLGLQFASIIVCIVPVLIIYLIFQKSIVRGLTAGAVKG